MMIPVTAAVRLRYAVKRDNSIAPPILSTSNLSSLNDNRILIYELPNIIIASS